MAHQLLDFEKPIAEIDKQIEKLRAKVAKEAAKSDKERKETREDEEDAIASEVVLDETPTGLEAEEIPDATEAETAPGEAEPEEPAETEPEAIAEAETPPEPEAEAAPDGDALETPDSESIEEEEEEEEEIEAGPPGEDVKDSRSKAERRLAALEAKRAELDSETYDHLTAWQRILIARHMGRPRAFDYIQGLMTDWMELKGDRYFHEDSAVVTGLARFEGRPVAVIGQQKGRDTKENVARNFGMMHPEGYRKALRIMRLAERFSLPIVVLIDTPGAYPGIGAEERGQSEAIARNIMEMFSIRTPIVGVIIGEGASGGALGVGVVDYMMMFENSWYCVISPEGCASILWRDASKAPEVAEVLKLAPENLKEFGVSDETVPEPRGGAHHDPARAIENLREPLRKQLERLASLDVDTLLKERFDKYRRIGIMAE